MNDPKAADELIPLDAPPGHHFSIVIPADDPWLLEAGQTISRHPMRDARVAVVPFWLASITLGDASWDARGAGLLALPPDGNALSWHTPGKQQVFMELGGDQRCYVATWQEEQPILVEVWEMWLEKPGTEVAIRVFWRPDFTAPRKPKTEFKGPEVLSRKERAALEKDFWNFMEGKGKGGRTPLPRKRNRKFEQDLEEAVLKVIHQPEGKPPPLRLVLEAMVYPDERYGKELEGSGWTREQIREWIRDVTREYWEDRRGPDWKPSTRLQDLPRRE